MVRMTVSSTFASFLEYPASGKSDPFSARVDAIPICWRAVAVPRQGAKLANAGFMSPRSDSRAAESPSIRWCTSRARIETEDLISRAAENKLTELRLAAYATPT